MNTPAENSREVVDRFLGKLGEPLSPLQVERAISRVRNRLDDAEALSVSVDTPRTTSSFRWSAVAAAALVMLLGGAVQMLFMRPVPAGSVAKAVGGEVYFAESYRPLYLAARIEGGQLVRAGSQGGTIALLDGSRIEMSPQAELSIVHASDGMRVRLGSGMVIVTAAKQRDGHLYVETKDLLVSVVGTVFSVSAEAVGSRVSVIEGEVHVQQGTTVQTLLPGQQASTNPALGPLPVETALGWSKSAGELVALLQQSVPVIPAPVPSALPQAVSRVIQGTVRLASKQEGIAGVTVTICPGTASRFTLGRIYTPNGGTEVTIGPRTGDPTVVGPRFTIGRTFTDSNGATAVTIVPRTGEPTAVGPIIRDKTLFFGLWDGVAACRNPVQTKTDASGHFQLQDLSPGDYVVHAELEGYFGLATNGSYPTFASQQMTVDAQQPLAEISLSLVRGGAISGRVRDSEGKVMANTNVSAVPKMSGIASLALFVPSSRVTDDRGEYRLFGLPPGEYYVGVAVQGVALHVDGAGGGVVRYFSGWTTPLAPAAPSNGQTFFPNAASVNEAAAIVLKEGEEVSGIDIMMRPVLPTDTPVFRR